MRKLWIVWAILLVFIGSASAAEKKVEYSKWSGHAVELAVDMGYVEVRVKFESKTEMTNKEACIQFLEKEVGKLASGKVIDLADGYTFQFKGGSPLKGHSEGAGHQYYNKLLVFGMDAKIDGKTITARGE